MTDGGSSPGGPSRTCGLIEIHDAVAWQDHIVCSAFILAYRSGRTTRLLEFPFGRILGRRHDGARNLPHVLAGIGELAAQELRLNLHRFLKIGGMNELAGVVERRLHVLLGEGQGLL